jgi:hypothetical protein
MIKAPRSIPAPIALFAKGVRMTAAACALTGRGAAERSFPLPSRLNDTNHYRVCRKKLITRSGSILPVRNLTAAWLAAVEDIYDELEEAG